MREVKDQPINKGLSRRQFAAVGATAAVAGFAGSAQAAALPVSESLVQVNGSNAHFVHPAEGSHPGVVLWADQAGLRSANVEIARDLAGRGFSVLLVERASQLRSDTGVAKVGQAMTDWLGGQPSVEAPADGFAVHSLAPMVSPLTPRGMGRGIAASYMVAMPRGNALSAQQRLSVRAAIDATHRLARATA